MKKLYLSLFALAAAALPLAAQTCWNGGTGADGSYTATSNTTLPGGIYNYTTFTIDPGVTVTASGTQPLIIHCTGAVTINGTLSVAGGNGTDGITYDTCGFGGIGVAGGMDGGNGNYSSSTGPLDGTDGFGTGGFNTHGNGWSGGGGGGFATYGDSSGMSTGGYGGPYYGGPYLMYMESGSGGGGGSGGYSCGSGGGGAGGGYLSIQSAVSITIGAGGMISANGGNGGSDGGGNCGGGGGGSGGGLWIVAPALTNDGTISATGGTGGSSQVPGSPYYGTGANGSDGYIRLDYNSVSGSGTVAPSALTLPSGTTPLGVTVTTTPIVCYGDTNGTATAVVTGGGGMMSYDWSPNGETTQTITGQLAGTYTVLVTDEEFCTAAASGTVTAPASALTGTITGTDETSPSANDGTATVTAAGGEPGYTYSWAPSGGTAASATGLSGGTYTCTITDANGCTLTQTITIATLTGIAANANDASVTLFPNPSNGLLQVNVQLQQPEAITISVLNLLGETVLQSATGVQQQAQQTLDLSSLPNGAYLVRVTAGNERITKQVMLQQ